MSNADDHLWITWDDYHRAIEALVVLVAESGWQFDQVLCLARGGLRIGDVFSRVFEAPLAILSASSYRKEAGTLRGPLDIARHITMPAGTLAGRILLIDDLVDSGITMAKVREHVRQFFPEVSDIKSAVIWYKACSAVKPDFFLEYLPDSQWIHQPFEVYDGMGIVKLKEKLQNP